MRNRESLKNFILSFRAFISCERKIRARHDYKIAEMKLTQIHTYRNGVFEGTNYRATHFRPMSRQSPFLTACRRGNMITRACQSKRKKWHLLDVDKTSHTLSRKKNRTKKCSLFPDSLCIPLLTPRYLTCQHDNFAEYLKVICAHISPTTRPTFFSPGPSFRTSMRLGRRARKLSTNLHFRKLHSRRSCDFRRDLSRRNFAKIPSFSRIKFYSKVTN